MHNPIVTAVLVAEGRDNHASGKPYLWMARNEDFPSVRARKTQRDRIRRQSVNKPKV